MNRFAGRVALVTGAASGIGAATARRLAGEGASVIVADVQDSAGDTVASGIAAKSGTAVYQHCDVASLADWQRLAERTLARYGRIDVVINNAYTLVAGPAHELAEADWDRQIEVCLKPLYLSARACMTQLQAAGGAMVNVSSVHALVGRPGHPAYAAAKGAICALTRQLAVEYGPRVRINAVLPGAIDTPASASTPDVRAEFERHIVAGRLGTADEVAAAICFLASAEASYITGAMLVVDGGWSVTKE